MAIHGGRLQRRRHRQAAARRGQALPEHRQELRQGRDGGARDAERGRGLRRQRGHEVDAAAPARAARALPEEPLRVPRDQARRVPALLLRVGPDAARDPLARLGPAGRRAALPVGALRQPRGRDLCQGRQDAHDRDAEPAGRARRVRAARRREGQHRGLAAAARRRHAGHRQERDPARGARRLRGAARRLHLRRARAGRAAGHPVPVDRRHAGRARGGQDGQGRHGQEPQEDRRAAAVGWGGLEEGAAVGVGRRCGWVGRGRLGAAWGARRRGGRRQTSTLSLSLPPFPPTPNTHTTHALTHPQTRAATWSP